MNTYSTSDILARLQNGESTETIANEMAEALNKALAQYEAKLEQTRVQEKKKKEAETIAKMINGYAEDYYGHLGDIRFTGSDIDKLFTSVESFIDMVSSENNIDKIIENFIKAIENEA